MSTSDHIKIRTELLIMLDRLRRLPLAEFLEEAEACGADRSLYDHDGLPVAIAPGEVAMARAALSMVSAGPHAQRKACVSERGGCEAVGDLRRAG